MSVDSSNNINFGLLTECIDGTYTINDDGSIDVNGNVILACKNITKIPFNFKNVSGYFHCIHNSLTSLEGVPITVGKNFVCCGNPNLPYSALFKIVDNVKGNIYYSSLSIPEDKDKIRRDRDIKTVLKDDELGNLDV